jgi:hypothetical protein
MLRAQCPANDQRQRAELRPARHPMSRATPLMREFAGRLVALETKRTRDQRIQTPVAFEVCEKLRPYLGTLMGKAGFCALLSRALALAEAEAPALRAVRVLADGSLAGCEAPGTPAEAQKVAEGSVVLLAQLLGLLEAFIGRNLTLRMLRDVWPKLTLNESHFSQDDPQ